METTLVFRRHGDLPGDGVLHAHRRRRDDGDRHGGHRVHRGWPHDHHHEARRQQQPLDRDHGPEQESPVGDPVDEESARGRAAEEGDECPQRGDQGELRDTGEREPGDDHIAGHAGDEDPTQGEEADGVDDAGDQREDEQQHRQRSVPRLGDPQARAGSHGDE